MNDKGYIDIRGRHYSLGCDGWRPRIWRLVRIYNNGVQQSVGLFPSMSAVRRRCWREVRREIHLKRFGRYPQTEQWEKL